MKNVQKVKIRLCLDIEVEVEGIFTPGRAGVMYDSSGDVGDAPEAAEFEIQKVKWEHIDITQLLENESYDFYSMENDCLEKIDNQEDYSNFDEN